MIASVTSTISFIVQAPEVGHDGVAGPLQCLEEQLMQVIDAYHVPETLVTGPSGAYISGNVLVLTCTAARPNIDQVLAGSLSPDIASVVVARLAFPLDNAVQVARVLNDTLADLLEQPTAEQDDGQSDDADDAPTDSSGPELGV
jgi:hypothetical protein